MSKIKVYFKGGEGIKEPVDFKGQKIEVGDILTHDWFREGTDKFFKEYYPQLTTEEINERKHRPSVVVKWNDKGYFYGEGIEESRGGLRLYMHDFCFKHTKIVKKGETK